MSEYCCAVEVRERGGALLPYSYATRPGAVSGSTRAFPAFPSRYHVTWLIWDSVSITDTFPVAQDMLFSAFLILQAASPCSFIPSVLCFVNGRQDRVGFDN